MHVYVAMYTDVNLKSLLCDNFTAVILINIALYSYKLTKVAIVNSIYQPKLSTCAGH